MHCLHDWNIYYIFPEPGGSTGLCLILVSVAQTPSWDCIATECCKTTCNSVTGCNWRLPICPSGSLAHLRWIADILKFAWNAIQIDTIFNISPDMDQIVLLEYVASTDDVHIKYIHHWQLLACLRSWTQRNFTGKPAVNAWDRLWFGNKCSHMM